VINQSSSDPVKFQFEDRISIEITEKPNEEYILQTQVHQKDAQPYFLDDKIGLELKPVYSHTTLEFNIVLRARSRDRGKRIRDEILARRAMGRETHLHEVDYSYCVPDLCVALLKQVYELREQVAGYGDDFSKWVRDHITDRATNLTNQSGKRFALAILEHQSEILGWFDFPAVPDNMEKDHDAGTWNWSITYVTNYDKIIGTAARWPLVVHNQFMPRPWHNPKLGGNMVDPGRRVSRAGQFKNAIRTATGNYLHKDYDYHRSIGGYIYPSIDEWEPEYVKPDTSTVLIALMQVDLNDPYYIGQIDDFGEFKVSDDLKAYMKKEWKYLTQYLRSAVHVTLFENGIELEQDLIEVDKDLHVRKKGKPLNPRLEYRLRVSLINNLGTMQEQARDTLLDGSQPSRAVLKTILHKTTEDPKHYKEKVDKVEYPDPLKSKGIKINDRIKFPTLMPGWTKEEKLENWNEKHKDDNPKPPVPVFEDDPIPYFVFRQLIIAVNDAKKIHFTGQEYANPHVGQYLVVLNRLPGA